MKYLLIVFLFSIAVISCDKEEEDYLYYDVVPLQGQYSETFNILSLVKDKKIDILWVIDNSLSMKAVQSNVIKNTALFMQAFDSNTHIEWKMGVISTDRTDRPYLGFDKAQPFDHNSPDPVKTFQSAVASLGIRGSGNEYTFFNIDRMITESTRPGQVDNSHFFRPDAHLVVIMVTDEEEQSANLNSVKYLPVNFINHLSGFKDESKIFRFYGAFDFLDLKGCVRNEYPSGNYNASAFEEIIDKTQGFAISACDISFGNELAKVGDDIVSLLKSPSIPLNARPIVDSIEVLYKGQVLPRGPRTTGGVYYYDRLNSTVNFYNLDFASGDLKEADIEIRFDIDDGVDRDEG